MKTPATPSHRQEQGREAFRLFGYYAHNPYAPRINDICAYENWLEGFLQEQWAAEWKLRHEATFNTDEAYALFLAWTIWHGFGAARIGPSTFCESACCRSIGNGTTTIQAWCIQTFHWCRAETRYD